MLVKKLSIITLFILSIIPVNSYSEDFIQWQTTNIQYLRGWNYEFGNRQRSIITFEHANGWKYGDFYMFADFTRPDDGDERNAYAEFSPRFSLSKITEKDFSNDFIKDVLVTTTIEKVKNTGTRYLYGFAVDLKIPGFKYFKSNHYIRDDDQLDGETWQVTLAWNYPFEIANTNFLIEGFADFFGGEENKRPGQLVVPRFLVDVGDLAGVKEKKYWAGIELQHWHNKFGVDGKSETVPQLQFKYVF